ncbi:MAG: tyrosine-type recombinase/integrase [Anaerolineales bacterium]
MAIRRGKKEGTIYKRPNGKWRAQLSVDGRRLSFTCKSQSECLRWLREMNQKISSGFSFKSSKLSYGEFLSSWLSTVEAQLRRSTVIQYAQIVKHYIAPDLGRLKLGDLNADKIQRLYDSLIRKGKSRRTVQLVHAVVHRSLNQAVRLGLLHLNPDDATSPPKPQEKEMRTLDQEQVQRFLLRAMNKGLKDFAFYFFLLATGVRQGEVLGLKWDDIDFGKRTVKIVRQVKRFPGGGFEFVPPKTKNGYRTIKLGKETVQILQKHYASQLDEKAAVGSDWKEHGLIFPSRAGTPLNPNNVVRAYRLLLHEAELPVVRFHDLRHTAASLMLNNGIDVFVVSRRLGHAKASITLDVYGHLLANNQERSADMLEELINPISVSAPKLHPIESENAEIPQK